MPTDRDQGRRSLARSWNEATARRVVTAMESVRAANGVGRREIFRMEEFDAVAAERSIAEVLRANLESAEAQLRLGRRRARRAQRRADELDRAVHNWHELIHEYEQATKSAPDHRLN
jgi:hypothetical protein